jgi:hypothetical protein
MGVELEIENCNEEWCTAGFKVVPDGSLRNSGLEFVSSPMTYSNMVYALDTFYDRNKPQVRWSEIYPEEYDISSNYSDRTSIHVHTNVGDLTIKQLQTLCLLYEVFENLLFAFVGNDRDKNIFCVPWQETTLSYSVIPKLVTDPGSIRNWQKYTALNLLPIMSQGSVEWRHLHGTSNRDQIYTWLRLIGHMYAYVLSCEFDKTADVFKALNTSSAYDKMLDEVYKGDADRLRVPNYRVLLEEGVLAMKFALMEPAKQIKVSKNIDWTPAWTVDPGLQEEITRLQQDLRRAGQVRFNPARDIAAGTVVRQAPPGTVVFDDLSNFPEEETF